MKKQILGAALVNAALAVTVTAEPNPVQRTDSTATELPVLIVEASRTDETAAQIPARVEVYSGEEIAKSGALSVTEFLSKRANFHIRTVNANPLQAQLSLRGYGENSFGRCKVLLDGETLNAVDMEPPNLARIPLDQIERIEILRGPQTVLHGDSSSAGVVNIITLESYADATRLMAKAGSRGTAGLSARKTEGNEENGTLCSAAYDYLRSDGYRRHSGYQTHAITAKAQKEFDDGSVVAVKVNGDYSEYAMPGALSADQMAEDRRQALNSNDDARLRDITLTGAARLQISDETYAKTDLVYARKNRHVFWGSLGYSDDYTLDALSVSQRLITESALAGHDNKAIFGADASFDWYDIANGSSFMPPDPRFTRLSGALFAHDAFSFTDDLSFIAGARCGRLLSKWQRYPSIAKPENGESLFAYEAGVIYAPAEDLKTYLRHTSFYRTPFCDEMSYCPPDETLDRESGFSLDLGADASLTDNIQAFIALFGTWTDDEIFYNPYHSATPWGWAGYNCNAPSRTRRLGFDTGFSWEEEKTASFLVKYSFVDARFTEGQYRDCEVPLVPRSLVRAETGVWLNDELEFRLGCRFTGKQHFGSDFLNENGTLASATVFDAALFYQHETKDGNTMKISLAADNLFDKKYCDYAGYSDYTGRYYYPAAGRALTVSVSYEY